MRVNQLAKRVGVTPDTVRFYTREGLLNPSKDPYNGYKDYGIHELKRMQFINKTRRLGFSVSEIKEVVNTANKGKSPCCRVREIVKHRLDEARNTIAELQSLVDRMQVAVDTWEVLPDKMPDGDSVCGLIDMWEDFDLDDANIDEDQTNPNLKINQKHRLGV